MALRSGSTLVATGRYHEDTRGIEHAWLCAHRHPRYRTHTCLMRIHYCGQMTSTDHRQEQLFAQRGLGFVRIAMEAGVPILPMYGFGENQLFHTSQALLQSRLGLVRRLRVGAPLFAGRWGIPFLLVPVQRAHVTLVIGRPVEVGPPNPTPSSAEVQAVFERYVDEVARIFETHAARYLPAPVAGRGLRVEWIGHGQIRHVVAHPSPR